MSQLSADLQDVYTTRTYNCEIKTVKAACSNRYLSASLFTPVSTKKITTLI